MKEIGCWIRIPRSQITIDTFIVVYMKKNKILPNFDPFSGDFWGILGQKGILCDRIRLNITTENNLSLVHVYPPLTNLKFIWLSLPHHLYLVALFCAEYHKGLNYPHLSASITAKRPRDKLYHLFFQTNFIY